MINIVTTIPYVGNSITKFIRCSSYVIINRILIIHYAVGFGLSLLICLHPTIPHNFSSSCPSINNISPSLIPPILLFFKDCFSYIGVFSIYSIFLYYEPDILGNENNQTLANSSVTPPNTIPERYFPPFHSVLRAIPVKLIGAIPIMPLFFLCLFSS